MKQGNESYLIEAVYNYNTCLSVNPSQGDLVFRISRRDTDNGSGTEEGYLTHSSLSQAGKGSLPFSPQKPGSYLGEASGP